ncbi:hypothetical protein C7B76_25770 [filamentous cyanobacterium CCP2]|nr:hypothetical protein C7B76_25770 [filamentous cyanobacterium CCP2]
MIVRSSHWQASCLSYGSLDLILNLYKLAHTILDFGLRKSDGISVCSEHLSHLQFQLVRTYAKPSIVGWAVPTLR